MHIKLALTFCFAFTSIAFNRAYAATFNSNGTGNFHSSSTWLLTSGTDSDGVPDINDDATILSSHVVTIQTPSGGGPSGGAVINNLTINLGGQLTMNWALTIYGDYNNSGTETGSNNTYFRGVGRTISGTGTFSTSSNWHFGAGCSITIASTANITKPNPITVNYYPGANVTNNGTFRFWASNLTGTGIVYTNGSTGITRIGFRNFMLGQTFNASAVGNTIEIGYANQPMPTPVGGIYHHLTFISPLLTGSQNITVNGNFTINNTGGFNPSGFNIDVKGNVALNGVWTPSTGTFTLSGTTAQSISTTATSTRNFSNLVINNSAGVSLTNGTYQLTTSLTISSGNLNLNSRSFTMTSDATTTAIIGPSNGTISNASNFVAQRFIAGRTAGYSDMAGSIVGQTLADFDDELLLVYTYSPPDFYPSVFGYDETTFDYVPITAASQTLDPGVGFEVFLDSDGSQTTFNNTTILNEGTPTIGDVDMSGYVTNVNDGWNLLGNPFHANLDWDVLHATTTDISTDLQFYDESIEDFTTVSTGSGVLIAPNQGFWVNVTGGSPNIVLSESSKSNSTSSNFRQSKPTMFGLRLKNIGETRFTSGTSFRFSATPELEVKGSLPFKKVPHPIAPGLSSVVNGKNLKINLLNSTASTVTVPLQVYIGVNGVYTIEAENVFSAETEGYNCITLIDYKTNTVVDLKNEIYHFSGDVTDKDRFSLVLSKEGDCKKSTLVDAGSNNTVNITRIGDNTIVDLDFASETEVTINVIDLLGQQICPAQRLNVAKQEVAIPMPADFQGIYLVNVTFEGKTITRKLFR